MTRYHLVGIKGTGMSSLARLLHDVGYEVQGSDVEKYFFTEDGLRKSNIPIYPFHEKNIKEDLTIIVGNAFKKDHIEVQRAEELGLPIYWYHDFLGEFASRFKSIAITGSHGKTSTTGLLAHVLSGACKTSFLIGDGTGVGQEQSEYFAFEACEYQRHFLAYRPDYCVMTNIDFDHPDYFENIEDVFEAFQEMAMQVNKGIIACGDDHLLQKIQANVPIVYYGFNDDNDFQAKNIHHHENGTSFDVFVRNTLYGTFNITGYGNHNILNALAVIALAQYEQLSIDVLTERLQTFEGVKRRFNEKMIRTQVLIDDYAHHPVEITATIEAARNKYPEKEIVAIFQPHTFTRTKTFLDEFANSLQQADSVYLCDIFSSAREHDGTLTIEDLQQKIPGAILMNDEVLKGLQSHENAVLLFMGAGDIQKYEKAYEALIK